MKWQVLFVGACLLFPLVLPAQRRPSFFEAPACRNYVQQHKTIAILPFYVLLDSNRYEQWKSTSFFQSRQAAVGFYFQLMIYRMLLVNKDRCPIEIQDVFETNAHLAELKLDAEHLLLFNKQLLADQLGVDAVLYGMVTAGQEDFKNKAALDSLVQQMFPANEKPDRKDFFMALFDKNNGLFWSLATLRDELTGTVNLQYLQTFLLLDVQSIPYWTGKKFKLF